MVEKPSIEDQIRELRNENLRLKAENALLKGKKKVGSRARNWFVRTGSNVVVGKGLKNSVRQLYSELPGQVRKETIADVSSYLFLRLTRIGVFTLMLAIIPMFVLTLQTFILGIQNSKIEKQNSLILNQNRRLDQQIHLEEGNRRSSFIFLMSNIMDKIDEELKDNRPGDRSLSNELIGRIVSLSQALRPYRYLEEDELIARQLSPERGQFLYALLNSYLSEDTYEKIFAGANFSYSDLKEANFQDAHLVGANLSNSYFPNANFENANLGFVDLSYADMSNSSFEHAYMSGANLQNSNLRLTKLVRVIAESANLTGANLAAAKLSGDFSSIQLDGVNLDQAQLGFVNLENAYYLKSAWRDSLDYDSTPGLRDLERNYSTIKKTVLDTISGLTDSLFILKSIPSLRMQAEACEKTVLRILKSNEQIKRLMRKVKGSGDELEFIPEASLFDDVNKTVFKDSVYIYRLITENKGIMAPLMTVQFNPRSKLLERYFENGEVHEMFYDERLLVDLDAECLVIH